LSPQNSSQAKKAVAKKKSKKADEDEDEVDDQETSKEDDKSEIDSGDEVEVKSAETLLASRLITCLNLRNLQRSRL
jgi:hypothetical protein